MIEMVKYRMKPGSFALDSNIPCNTRLKSLHNREHNWGNLSYRDKHKISLLPTGCVYEFVGDVYANGRETDRLSTGSISFYSLPSSASDSERRWTHHTENLNIVDFTMDPAQDLLVLVATAPET
jgi:hypothetical protein